MPESEPLVKTRFSFGEHGPEGIRFLPKAMDEAESFFTSAQEFRNIYLMEMVGMSETLALRFKNLARRTGSYLDAFIQILSPMTFGRHLEPIELGRLRDAILADSPEEIVRRDPGNPGIFALVEAVELQKLRQRINFEVALESYPEKEAKRLAKIDRRSKDLVEQAYNQVLQGSIDQSIRSFRESILLTSQSNRARNLAFIGRIAQYSREAHRQHRPTRVFIRIGENHDILLDRLTSQWEEGLPEPEISHYYDFGQAIPRMVFTTLADDLELNPQADIPKEKVLRAILESLITTHQQVLAGKARLERAQVAKRVIASTTSLEIEELISSLPRLGFERAVGQFVYSKLY